MFRIQPVRSRELQEEIARGAGCPFFPDTYAFYAAELTDDAEAVTALLGLCQFTYAPTVAVIKSLAAFPGYEHDEALFILVRAVMAFLNRAEIPFVYAEDTAADPAFLKRLLFRRTSDGRLGIDLGKFYRSPCGYKENVETKNEE